MVGCALWIKQNVSPEEFEQAAAQMQEGAEKEAVAAQAKEVASSMFKRMRSAKPLKIAVLPGFLTEPASHFTAGLAGLLLILSAFCASRLKVIVLLVMAAALVRGALVQLGMVVQIDERRFCWDRFPWRSATQESVRPPNRTEH